MRKPLLAFALGAVLAGFSASPALADGGKSMTMYKSPTCGCCGGWADHMRASGYEVTEKAVDDMDVVKQMFGVPGDLLSCHTAVVDGYVVEGHVPAADVDRLLAERPAVKGLSAPGMPADAPGMDANTGEPYDVVTFDEAGATGVYATH